MFVFELTYKTFTQKPSARELVNHLHENFPGAEYYSAYEAGFSGLNTGRSFLSPNAADATQRLDTREEQGKINVELLWNRTSLTF